MEQWKIYKLGELYGVQNGLSKGGTFFGSGFPFLSFKTVFNNYFIPTRIYDLVQSTPAERERFSVKRGDIFITRTSETSDELGMSCVSLHDIKDATYNGFCKRLRPLKDDIVYPEFIGYLLRSKSVRSLFGSFTAMTTRASLKNADLLNIQIALPNMKEQKRIASILSSLDSKIELNHRINDNLEQQAQALFNHYFIESPDLLKDITVGNLTQIASYVNGLAMQRFRPNDYEVGLPVLKIKELGQNAVDSASDRCTHSIDDIYKVFDGDVIFSWSGTLLVKIWTGGNCGLNQHLFKVTSKKYPKWFYYFWTKHHLDRFIRIAKDKAVTMGHIKRGELEKSEVLIPCVEKLNQISERITPLFEKSIKCSIENRHLTELKDALLPKLMSGELKINDLHS